MSSMQAQRNWPRRCALADARWVPRREPVLATALRQRLDLVLLTLGGAVIGIHGRALGAQAAVPELLAGLGGRWCRTVCGEAVAARRLHRRASQEQNCHRQFARSM